jgi:hypothetical protein
VGGKAPWGGGAGGGGSSEAARGRSPPEEPGIGGLEGRGRVGGENVDRLPFGTMDVALGIGVSGSSSTD